MTNSEIAKHFNLLGKLMELHGENPFKFRSYYKVYNILRKVEAPLKGLTAKELQEIEGVGKNIADKIVELSTTGEMQTLQRFQEQTPIGVQEMLLVRGFGPKKVKQVWEQLGVENIGELLYACQENRLSQLKGFGAKTQATLIDTLQYVLESKGKYHLGKILPKARIAIETLHLAYPQHRSCLTGAIRRHNNVVESIDIMTTLDRQQVIDADPSSFAQAITGDLTFDGYPLNYFFADEESFGTALAHSTGPASFADNLSAEPFASEEEVFDASKQPLLISELRDLAVADRSAAQAIDTSNLVTLDDIRGIIHNHSTYSDGIHSLRDMAIYCRDAGFEYLVMSDHSQYAGYANGLSAKRVYQQMQEINLLNEELAPFKIFKSIECDILPDGSLDYTEDLLSELDIVICSVHAGLKMSQEKAMDRLARAIASPYCHVLGHMTGRLLLSREGYPVNHREIIDLCSDNKVAIELNANPYRLDMDWEHIPYAMEKGVLISINPDAHSKEAIHYIEWGVASARKGGLTKSACLNTKSLAEFESWLETVKI